ncbi:MULTISPECIES: hypothetical protein [Tsukamurella]|uniref:Uncharacterized protein n=2 Tax=Tsukamurella TaxID=2060 RepID=A0A5C5RUT1_9ACTN|nr:MULTISPECIES: hypothetical protein [Tsukamurella]NMD56309.1 hypothetical protein [Tsukamurella columbiensis]TWS26747.1 hypothetical protein FK530_22100 [Tsukamurella conjunctivitidis]
MTRIPRALARTVAAAALVVAVPVAGTATAAPTPKPAPAPGSSTAPPSAAAKPTGPVASPAQPTGAVSTVTPGVNPADIQCPLGWPKPREKGGLASLILLAPAAGAFTDEAFAAGQAYDPILSLLGPFLAAIKPVIEQSQPALAGPVGALNAAEQAVYDAIKPLYAQYRPKVIEALTRAGDDLAPALQELAATPAAACLVAWEDQVLIGLQTGKWSPIATGGLAALGELAASGKGGAPAKTATPVKPSAKATPKPGTIVAAKPR